MAKAAGPRSAEDALKLRAFEERMQLPILVSALLPIILSMADNDNVVANLVIVLTWFVFVFDFVVHMKLYRAYLHRGRGKFDLVVVILTAPWFLIPGLGNARILGLARLARLARVVKAMGNKLMTLLRQLGTVGIVTGIILLTCAYTAYGAEKATNPEFKDFGQSLWWAIVTITTVGYGDVVPITRSGRLSGVILMVSGVALLGVLAGTLASFFGFGGGSSPAPAAATSSGGASPASTAAAATAVASGELAGWDDTAPSADELEVMAGQSAAPSPAAASPAAAPERAAGPATEPAAGATVTPEDAAAEIAELRVRLAELDAALVAVRAKIG